MRAALGFLAVIVLLVASCSSAEDLAAAEREVEKFHQAYDAGQFDELYEKAADDFKKSSTKQEFVIMLEAIQRKLGKTAATKRGDWKLNFSTGGTMVALTYETSFARGKGTEQFNYRMAGKKALLVGYNLNSKDLLLR
jgi:opacity protein-like surface antigen